MPCAVPCSLASRWPMTETVFRLHPLSWIFHTGKAMEKLIFPLLAALALGHRTENWRMWAIFPLVFVTAWAIFKARAFRCEIGDGELLIREGLFDKTQRHIPFSRIQSVSQRRKLLHRLLGVTEVQIDSAAGSKPEAVMKVLGLPAAKVLEDFLRDVELRAAGGPASAAQPSTLAGEQETPPLFSMSAAEIVRYGIVSNRGAVVVGIAYGAIWQHKETRELALANMHLPFDWIGPGLKAQLLEGHWLYTALAGLLALALLFVVLRILSVVLAFMRYHDFTLDLHGERLTVRHGLSTRVKSGTRLPRLQRFVLQEGWLHRRLSRCRLAVDVVGAHGREESAHEASAKFTELAPIATQEQAQALLRVCLPELRWDTLDWRSLDAKALTRRLMVKARLLVPAMLGLAFLDYRMGWRVPVLDLAIVYALVAVATFMYAVAWLRFSAVAESGDLLLFRSGVWKRNWVIVRAQRLQNVRLVTSPLDVSLGLVQLEGDIMGGPRGKRGLVIPCLSREDGEALRDRLWRKIV
jgi:putative membrane protein